MAADPTKTLGQRIARFRKELDLKQKDLASQLGVGSPQIISQIERGDRDVKAWELAKLSKIFHVSVSDLLATDEPEALPSVLWRVLPKMDKEIKEKEFLKRCREYALLEELNGITPHRDFPQEKADPHKINFDDAQRLAERVRQEFSLGDRPALVLERTLLDRYGVKVWYDELEEGSAATTIGSFGPAILMNSKEAPWRRNYNFAHEVFHLITWESIPAELLVKKPILWKRIEMIANVFASCLLLPGDAVRVEFNERVKDGKIAYIDLIAIARSFDVSTEALMYRLLNLNLFNKKTVNSVLSDEEFRSIDQTTMPSNWWEPPKFPEHFVILALRAYQKGKLSRAKLAGLLETSLLDLKETLQEYVLDDRESYKTEVRAA